MSAPGIKSGRPIDGALAKIDGLAASLAGVLTVEFVGKNLDALAALGALTNE
jgi:hypothetical protein